VPGRQHLSHVATTVRSVPLTEDPTEPEPAPAEPEPAVPEPVVPLAGAEANGKADEDAERKPAPVGKPSAPAKPEDLR